MEQIKLADFIILNKTDLVRKEMLEDIETGLMKINISAKIIRAQDCAIDTDIIFGQNRTRGIPDHDEEATGSHDGFSGYFDFVCDFSLDHDGFMALLDALPNDIIRAKGFVRTDKGNFLMNHISGRHTLEPFECQKTEMVFIGEGIEKHEKAVRQALERLRIER
jgi:G3E family GTPase